MPGVVVCGHVVLSVTSNIGIVRENDDSAQIGWLNYAEIIRK